MGSLRHFLLGGFIKRYKIGYFVETGTGGGDGLSYAAQFLFCKLYSTEIHKRIYELAKNKFADDGRVTLLNAKSEEALDIILPCIPQDVPILFWLDAHFPGADYKLARYDGEENNDTRLPLEREVEVIRRLRPQLRDILLIDDLRLYEKGKFANGNMPEDIKGFPPEKRNVDFVTKAFGKSHSIFRDYSNEGYLAVVPR
jgi:hypothetical protein